MGDVEQLPGRRVVVAALPLSARQLRTLGEQLGPSFRLVDIRDAPDQVEFVLCPPCSPQTTAKLCATFPGARVIALELQDPDAGLRIDGPVTRAMSGGASGYFVASSAASVGQLLEAASAPSIDAAQAAQAAIEAPTIDDVLLSRIEERARARLRGND